MKTIPDLQQITALGVWLHDKRVGVINRLAGDRHLFSFEQEYIDDPTRPTLSLSFKGQTSELITSTHVIQTRVPPFFSNLLPEGHLRTYLAERVGVKSEREFFLLNALGVDLPGAVIVKPLAANNDVLGNVEINPILSHEQPALRFSLAGVQLKFSAILEASGGLTIPANGMNGSWILKLPSTRFAAVPENEFVMLALARAIGINLPRNKLIDINEIKGLPENIEQITGNVLAIERFDRGPNGERIHIEDFAQVFGLFPQDKYDHRSYANIASVFWAEVGEAGTFEFMRRLIFSILIGNADMHLKNWSLIYPDGCKPEISPGYDFVATLPYIANDKLALRFGASRSLQEITHDQIRRFADTARLPINPLVQIMNETVERTIIVWEKLEEKTLLPEEMKKIIDQQIQQTALNILRNFK